MIAGSHVGWSWSQMVNWDWKFLLDASRVSTRVLDTCRSCFRMEFTLPARFASPSPVALALSGLLSPAVESFARAVEEAQRA